jgi:peptidoglycan/LPS O-acetylase OafA/YrhL
VGLPPLIASDRWVSFSRVSAFWQAFLHVQNYVRIEPRRATLDVTHLWSLSVEEHFYLALPLLLLVLSRRRIFHISPLRVIAIASAVVFAGCLASRIYVSLSSAAFAKFELYTPTHMRMDSLMAGVLLAAIVAFRRSSFERLRPWAWALLVAGMLCYVPYLVVDRSSFFGHTFGYSVLWIGSSLMVVWAWLRSTDAAVASIPRGRLLALAAVIGSYSYSIYLWHLPFGRIFTGQIVKGLDVTAPYAYAIYMMVYVLVSIAIGIVSYKMIEGPVLAWRDRVMPR